MTDLPNSGQSDSMDNVAVTREDFRQDIGEFLQYTAQAFGNITGTYTTETIDPTAVILRGTPTLAAGAEASATDVTLRLANTRWVKYNANSRGTAAPPNPVDGQTWIDLSQDPPVLKVWDETNLVWVSSTPAQATETEAGIAEIATQAETDTGTDDQRFVTPLKLATLLSGGGTGTGFLPLDGGNLTGGITFTERTISASFDLATGNLWTAGAIAIPNPTNAVAAMSGLIRLTAAPTGWGVNFTNVPTAVTAPAIIPFYVESSTVIRLGNPVTVA